MAENKIAFLYSAATNLRTNEYSHLLLKSYYLMRCQQLTKGYGLPQKQFSKEIRCLHCYIEWTSGRYQTKIKPLKLSKKQKQRIRKGKEKSNCKEDVKKDLLHSNEMERICSFCKRTTLIRLLKPKVVDDDDVKIINVQRKSKEKKSHLSHTKVDSKKNTAVDIYAKSKDVFSLKNLNNKLSSIGNNTAKVIKNNKKKKDKFAGLCKAAVLASAKIKESKKSDNKLNIFLRPST